MPKNIEAGPSSDEPIEQEGTENAETANTETEPAAETEHESPNTESGTENEPISPEIKEAAERFDKNLGETLASGIGSEKISAEQASKIMNAAEELSPEEKADLIAKLDAEESPKNEMPEQGEQLKEEAQESKEEDNHFEDEINSLSERAKALGLDISAEKLLSNLGLMRELQKQGGEKPSQEELKQDVQDLSDRINELENMKTGGKPNKQKEEQLKVDATKMAEKMVTKTVEYAVKLSIKIVKGVVKGVVGGIAKGIGG